MNEEEIAEAQVFPFLENLGWPKQLLTKYGRVPVVMGTEVKYADIVALFIDDNDITFPYLVVEVKTSIDNLEDVKAQANSYAKQLDAQIFVVTDGKEYKFYQRIQWGGYIEINNVPVPHARALTVTEKTNFKTSYVMYAEPPFVLAKQAIQNRELERDIDDFFYLIAQDRYFKGNTTYSLRGDITSHYRNIKAIHSLIHGEIDSLKPEIFKYAFERYFMYKLPNLNRINSEIDKDFEKLKSFLKFVRDFKGNPQENLERMFDTNDKELHIKGTGPFILSQFLAGAHPREYAIIEDKMVNTMKALKLIDVKVHSDTPKGYLYINDVCKGLLGNMFKKKIEENKDKLGFEIDDDFDLVVMHEFFWEYEGFYGYDKSKLREVAGEKRDEEVKDTDENLQEVRSFLRAATA